MPTGRIATGRNVEKKHCGRCLVFALIIRTKTIKTVATIAKKRRSLLERSLARTLVVLYRFLRKS